MKLTVLIIFVGLLHVSAASRAQLITVTGNNLSLSKLFKEIKRQSGYSFLYDENLVDAFPNVNVEISQANINEVLGKLLAGKPLEYLIIDKSVVIRLKDQSQENGQKSLSRVIYGKIVDEGGLPLPGVTITATGKDNKSTRQWVSNERGEFTMVILDETLTVKFSFVGYNSQIFAVADMKSPFHLVMKPSSSSLDQVQVLAYGTTTKRLNTGSTYTITSEEIAKNPVPNVLQALNNRVPGLSIVQGTGQVGGSFTVRVRGINSIGNTIDPLYIVDGVPYPAGGNNNNPNSVPGGLPFLQNNRNSGTSAQLGGNALNYINPDDIESIDILKDADATSIYGSRGAYGVILITTKKGKAGKPKVTFNINQSVSTVSSTPKLLNTDDYLMIRREALKNDGLTVGPNDFDLNGTYSPTAYTNWAKVLLKSAPSTKINANYSGGNELTTFSISGNYDNYGNVELHNGFNRDGSLRLQVSNLSPNRKLSIDVTGLFTSTVNTMTPYDFTGDGTNLRAPNAPSYFNPDGSLNWNASGDNTNPYSYLNAQYRSLVNNILGSTTLSYRPVKGLTIKAVVAYNYLSGKEFRGLPSTVFNPATTNVSNSLTSTLNNFSIRTVSFDPYISYDTRVSKGQLTVSAGGSLQDKLNDQTVLAGTGFVNDSRLNNPTIGISTSNSYNSTLYRYDGLFGILRYNWKSKYIINFNGRYDGSTRFGDGHRYGFFGSVAGAYIFTEEKWIKEHLSFLSFGKIRGSYGTTGGDGIPNYQYLPTYSTNATYQGNPTYINNGLANKDLHWETDKKRDIGITIGLLNDRITLDAGYYKNIVTGSLSQLPLTNPTGFAYIFFNSDAKSQSTGWEFSATSTNIHTKTFNWTSNFALTVPRTKLLYYPPGQALTNSNLVEGQPLTNMKLIKYDGVDPQTGNYVFENAAGTKSGFILSPALADRNQNIDVSARYLGSISNTISYKNFSLDFTFSFQNKIGLTYQGSLSALPGTINQNETSWALDRWQNPGDITNVPKPTTNLLTSLFGQTTFRQSTGAYAPITFARLQNASFAYTLPVGLQKKLGLSNTRIFINGQNLFVISKFRDLDPENPSFSSLPPLRVVNVGLNVTL